MTENNNQNNSSKNLKVFFIKLISISIGVVIVVNLIFNLIFAERLQKIDEVLMLDRSDVRNELKEKIRSELKDGLQKKNIIAEEDKILLYKLYKKLKKEFEDLDKSKL
tara:strand:+ start:280 stop:603 length:324 start_codon:yes stop_codon:yes gene_type:complete